MKKTGVVILAVAIIGILCGGFYSNNRMGTMVHDCKRYKIFPKFNGQQDCFVV